MVQIIVDQLGGLSMENDNINTLVKDYVELDNEIKAQQLLQNEIKEKIIATMVEKGVDALEVDSRIVRYREVLSNVFCTSRLKEKYPELYTAFLRQVPSRKFSIS